MDVHLRALRYFVTVAEELHFTRAAERLFVSQPGLSQQIRRLEQDLRLELFERSGQQTTLTMAGQALLPHVQALLQDWDQAQRAASDAAAREASVLRVGMQTSVGRGLLPAITKRFQRRRPDWRITLTQVPWDDPSCGLADGSVDVAVVWLPLPEGADLHSRVIAVEQRVLVVAAAHPLSGRHQLRFSEIAGEAFVALPEQAGAQRDHWLATDHRGGTAPIIGAVAHSTDEAFEAVFNCQGVVVVAAGNAAMYQREGVVTLPLTDLPPCELALAWRTGASNPAVRDFVEAAQGLPEVDPGSRTHQGRVHEPTQ
ncbi:LysR family transcriptional regulator [soil metagenome]